MFLNQDEIIPFAASTFIGILKIFAKLYLKTLQGEDVSISKVQIFKSWPKRMFKHLSLKKKRSLNSQMTNLLKFSFPENTLDELSIRLQWVFRVLFLSRNSIPQNSFSFSKLEELKKFETEFRSQNDFENAFHKIYLDYPFESQKTDFNSLESDIIMANSLMEDAASSFSLFILKFVKITKKIRVCSMSLFDLFKTNEFENSNFVVFIFAWEMMATAFRGETSIESTKKLNCEEIKLGKLKRNRRTPFCFNSNASICYFSKSRK